MRIVLASPAAIKILGWEQDAENSSWKGKSILNILPERLSEELGRSLMQIATGDREGGEFRMRCGIRVQLHQAVAAQPQAVPQRAEGFRQACGLEGRQHSRHISLEARHQRHDPSVSRLSDHHRCRLGRCGHRPGRPRR